MSKFSSLVTKVRDRVGGDGAVYSRIDKQMDEARRNKDLPTLRRLVRLRHSSFGELSRSTEFNGNGSAPAVDFEVRQGLPVLPPSELTAEKIRAAFMTYGCLHVPGLIDEARVEQLKSGIDRVFDAAGVYEEAEEALQAAGEAEGGEGAGEADSGNGRPRRKPAPDSDPEGWYDPFKPGRNYDLGGGRRWNRGSGAIWAADSPRMSFEVTDTFEGLGMRDLIGDYLGERPALSMNKSVLRRTTPRKGGADWHQDGAFLGPDIRSLNVWMALSHCGENAPGMDMVPRRLDGVIPPGGDGANFDWSISHTTAERVAEDTGIVRPLFGPGDVLLFDHIFLHRTAAEESMTETRYAIETWFFAPSAYPDKQVPLVL